MNAPLFGQIVADPKPLRPYQSLTIEMLRSTALAGRRCPLIQLPTGAGKTRIAAEIIKDYLGNGCRVIFVVPRISLIEQTVAAFAREGIDHIGVIQGQNFRTDQIAPVQIASAQTLARRDIPDATVVIVDEAHLQFKQINEWIATSRSKTFFIGLTATPWTRGMGKIWDALLKPTSISELINQGFVTPFRVFSHPAPDLRDVRIKAGEFNEADLSEACDKTPIIADIVRTWIEKGEDRPTLCYGVDRKHAQHLQERFAEALIPAEYIDCLTPMYEREEIFARFTAAQTRVICNVATLDTGIDLDVRCIIDARPTKSRIRFVQTIGRGLRPAKGKDHCVILDHAGNHQRLGLVTEIDFSELDDGESNRNLDRGKGAREPSIKLCPECRCVLPPQARECPACGHRLFAITQIVERKGTLVELGSRGPRGRDGRPDEIAFIGMVKGFAKERGYKNPSGFAYFKFVEKFGRKPAYGLTDQTDPIPPDVQTRNWIRSRQIAFAKGRHAHG